MGEPEISHKLDELARRLERVEQELGITHSPQAETTSDQPPVPQTSSHAAKTPAGVQPAEAGQAAPSSKSLATDLAAKRHQRASALESARRGATPPTTPAPAPPATTFKRTTEHSPAVSPPIHDESDRSGIEVFLGIKAAAALGAVIVVIGTAFAIREYATGFWAALPTWMQALIIAGFGGVLIGAGEIAGRRFGRLASIGLMSAGLGVLYLDAYAAFQWFEPAVVSSNGSFLLMAVVAGIGFALTVRTRSLFIGALSLLAGYLTPLLLAGSDGNMLGLLNYLTMLFGVALALSAVMPKPFLPLRYAAIGGQGALALLTVLAMSAGEWLLVFVFLSIWWVMLMGESIIAASRGRSAVGNVIASLIGVAGYVTLGGLALRQSGPAAVDWLGFFLAMTAVLNTAAAMQFGPGLDSLRGRLTDAMDKLAAALWASAGVLLAAAIAFQFEGYGMAVGWLVLAVVGVELGRRLPSFGVSVFALIVGACAITRIIFIDSFSDPLRETILSNDWLTFTHWSVLALGGIAATLIGALRLGHAERENWRNKPIVLLALATIGWAGWWIMHGKQEAITAGWLAGCIALIAAQPWLSRQRGIMIGLVLLLAAATRWLLFDAIADRLDPTWDALRRVPMIDLQMGLAIAIAATGLWAVRRWHRETTGGMLGPHTQGTLIAVGVFFIIACSFEVDRHVTALAATRDVAWSVGHVRQLLFTMLWTMGGLGFGLLARLLIARHAPAARRATWLISAAWLMLTLTGLKWIVIDTLFWATGIDNATPGGVPFMNLQMLAGVLVAGSVLLMLQLRIMPEKDEHAVTDGAREWLTTWMPVGASALVLWVLTFEVDRWLMQRNDAGLTIEWPLAQWRGLWWIGLWTLGGLAMLLFGQRRHHLPLQSSGLLIVSLAAGFWLLWGTTFWRLTEGAVAAPFVMNVQFITGAMLLAILTFVMRFMLPRQLATEEQSEPGVLSHESFMRTMMPALGGLVAFIGLWLGSLEIDRLFIHHDMARQVAWSVYWSAYGVALVLLGFRAKSAACRYAGLALLALTVGKVLLIDLATVDQLWRIISFIVSGLLLIATSVAYARLAPRLLHDRNYDAKRAVELQ